MSPPSFIHSLYSTNREELLHISGFRARESWVCPAVLPPPSSVNWASYTTLSVCFLISPSSSLKSIPSTWGRSHSTPGFSLSSHSLTPRGERVIFLFILTPQAFLRKPFPEQSLCPGACGDLTTMEKSTKNCFHLGKLIF